MLIVPSILSLDIQKINTTSILTSWKTVNTSIIVDYYTVTVTTLCDNVVLSYVIDGKLSSRLIVGLLNGSHYRVSLTPVNILGEGMEVTEDADLSDLHSKEQFNNQFRFMCCCLSFIVIVDFFSQLSISFATLSWSTAVVSTNQFTFEVGFSATNTCHLPYKHSSLSFNYTSYINTTQTTITLTGLEANTCYEFGVRLKFIDICEHAVIVNRSMPQGTVPKPSCACMCV